MEKRLKFDVVVGNPPYTRQEKIKDIKEDLQKIYKTFTGTADIYIYFYEKGYNLLKENGILSYITSNKWTRAKYGKNFREFLLKNTDLLSYIDFNGVKVFESTTVDTSILEFKKSNDNSDFIYCDIDKDYEINMNLDNYIDKNGFEYKKADLDIEGFSFANPKELKIKKRIEEIGTPLKDWDININYGIKTGFNEAFIIDGKIKDELIAKDPKCAEIIKPLLRGRDIKKYKYDFADKWLIFIPWHFPLQNDNTISGVSDKAEKKFIEEYSSIYNHLLTYKEPLSNRNKAETGIRYEWYALQRCANTYYDEFEKEKIVYGQFREGTYHYDKNKMFLSSNEYFIISMQENLKYLTSILNAKISYYFLKLIANNLGGNTSISQKSIFLSLPVIKSKKTIAFETLVDYIIYLKENTAKYENTDLFSADKLFERVIDFMVYGLYFENEMKADGSYINDEVENILNNIQKTENIEQEITDVYNTFKNNKLIMKALTFCNVEEVKIIEESIKTNNNDNLEIDENEINFIEEKVRVME